MQRVDPKQLDALFEPPPADRRRGRQHRLPSRRRGARRRDRHRRFRQGRPAHRAHRRLRERSTGIDKLLQLTLDVGEGQHAQRVHRHQVGLQARAAGRQAHRDGRQPGAAQDEVRHQRRHGAGRLARRREGATRASTARTLAGRGARACGCAERATPWPRQRRPRVSRTTAWGDDGPTHDVEVGRRRRQDPRASRTCASCSTRPSGAFSTRAAPMAKAKNIRVRWPVRRAARRQSARPTT